MNRNQALNYARLAETLAKYRMAGDALDALLRIERTLSRWSEMECNGEIERDEESGKVYRLNTWSNDNNHGKRVYKVADKESGALKRLDKILNGSGLKYYHQGDPRGCALYILRPGDIPDGKTADQYYTRGVAICL